MQTIPVLSEMKAPVAPIAAATFAAFKEDEAFSFVREYAPAQCYDIAGYRHAVIRYRNTETSKVTKTAKLVTVPALVLPEEYSLLDDKAKKVIQGVYEDEQDQIIKNLIDEKEAKRIGWDLLTLDKILESLTAVRISQRLTKEQIENWFNVAGVSFCTTRAMQICEAKGISDATEVKKHIAGTLNAYKERMCKLAAPVPNLGTNEATACHNMLLVSKLEDDMAKVLKSKLHAILHPKVIENEYL